ncbi:hypothetical protein MAM1_0192d07673 [Mucor ambiguus]|uniref:C-type lectin domain-containing protein n=1 Tax=Mucor ambiguus TaxID=91626 RepID=A0A0C9MC35_9FUNG|nr:hypothetical protein MAM1_0192d07673 [Mucor ambiguus]
MLLNKSLLLVSLVFLAKSLATPALENDLEAEQSDGMEEYSAEQDVNEPVVCQGNSPFFIPPNQTSKANAAALCNSYNGDLAPVSNQNFVDVTSLLFSCKGPMAHAWIKTWDDTDYGSNCLTLYTGASIPGGGIDINCVGEDLVAPICIQRRDFMGGVGNQNKQLPPAVMPAPSTSSKYTVATGNGVLIGTSTSTSSTASQPFTIVEPIPDDTISFAPDTTPFA